MTLLLACWKNAACYQGSEFKVAVTEDACAVVSGDQLLLYGVWQWYAPQDIGVGCYPEPTQPKTRSICCSYTRWCLRYYGVYGHRVLGRCCSQVEPVT